MGSLRKHKLFYWNLLHHKHEQGFTLVELLVVVIIIGVISAIALPSYLNQVARARGSGAKSTLGSINRAQQAYRYEQGTFAANLSDLKKFASIDANGYSYSISGTSNSALASATPAVDDYKVYSAGVGFGSNDIFVQVICESENLKGSPTNNTAQALVVGTPTTASCTFGREIK
jgi:type IV pilus assembly protein PilA